MIRLDQFSKIYLYSNFVDMRKQIGGLSTFVQNELNLNPFENYLFIFCGKRRNCIKILYWEKTGFCMWQKKLEKEKFIWTKIKNKSCIEMSEEKLRWLIEGYDIWRMKNHETLNYKYIS